MRNLKRVLSLTLAAVMVLGLMITGAGAVNLDDFSDRDEIVNDEAVLVLTTLNVINGKSDGSYDPKGTVTRGEMTKMICVILNGGSDPVLAETVNNTYTDTVGHWAAPYIEYCTTLGIVAGRGDKKFDPDGNVSVAEAGKMLLVALGYNAGVEGYVGANWQINTDVRANQLDIYDGMEGINTSTILTRDNAALMCYNALDVHMVIYDYIITGNADNAITTKPQLNDSKLGTLLWEKFGAAKVTGVVLGNEFANMKSTKQDTDRAPSGTVIGSALDEGKTNILVTNHNDGQSVYQNQEYTFNISTGEEVLGKAVNLYIKPAKDSTNPNRATVIGSAIISEDNAIITDASGDSLTKVLDNNNLSLENGAKYAYNYASLGTTVPANKDGMKGVERTLIDTDGDNKVEYVLYREMRLGKVTLRSEANKGQLVVAIERGNYVTKDKADIAGFEDVAQDDYVLTAYFGGVLHVQEAETVTGKINAYKQTDGATKGTFRTTDFTVDSTNYSVSRVLTYTGDITAAIAEVDKAILSSEATFYLDESGNVIAYGEVDENAYKYVLVWGAEAGTVINGDRVKVTREDGTTATYYLSSNSDVDVIRNEDAAQTAPQGAKDRAKITENNMVGKVFGYSMTSGGEIKLYLPKSGTITGNTPSFTKGLTTINVSRTSPSNQSDPSVAPYNFTVKPNASGNYYSNNATAFFYVTMKDGAVDKVSVYNGRNNAPSVKGDLQGKAVLALNTKGDVGAVAFTGVTVTESAEDHMFVYKANFVSEDYVTVDAFMKGSVEATKDIKAALYQDNEVVHNPNVLKGIYIYKIDSDGNYELTKPTMDKQLYFFSGTVIRIDKNNNTFVMSTPDGERECKLDNKSIVVDYDSDHSNPAAVSGGTVNRGDVVEVIVNNSDDRVVLMAAIMERKDPSSIESGVTGVNMTWDGTTQPAGTVQVFPVGTSDTEKNIAEEFAAGHDVFIRDNYTLNANLTIPAGRKLYVTGDVTETGAYKITNNGDLYVGGKLTTVAHSSRDIIKNNAAGVLEVHGTWDMGDSSTIKGTARIGQDITATAVNLTLTVAKDAKLYAGTINLNYTGSATDKLVVNGHVEVNGYKPVSGTDVTGDVTAHVVEVNSSTTLKLGGLLKALTSLTVGTGTQAGTLEAGSVETPTATFNGGSVAVDGELKVTTTLSFGSTLAVSVEATNLTATGVSFAISKNVSVSVSDTLKATKVTVTDGTLESATVDGNLTIVGDATVTAPTVKGTVDEKDATTSNPNVGTSSNSVVTLTDKIVSSAVYSGKVVISKAVLANGITLTFNGEVSGLDTLSVADGGTARVSFGASATATGTWTNFVNGYGNAIGDAAALRGTSFKGSGSSFMAESGNAYSYGESTTTSAVLDSAKIYA